MRRELHKSRFGLSAALGIMAAVCVAPLSASALDVFNTELDKRAPDADASKAKTRTILNMKADDFKKLSEKKTVYVDIKILLDGKSKYQVLTSEETDNRRYNVDCRPGVYGRLPMADGVEYYVNTGDATGRRIDLSVFAGNRTDHPDNDVSCVADSARPNSAILRIRGLYKVLTNDFGDRIVVELRPILRSTLSADDLKKLP